MDRTDSSSRSVTDDPSPTGSGRCSPSPTSAPGSGTGQRAPSWIGTTSAWSAAFSVRSSTQPPLHHESISLDVVRQWALGVLPTAPIKNETNLRPGDGPDFLGVPAGAHWYGLWRLDHPTRSAHPRLHMLLGGCG